MIASPCPAVTYTLLRFTPCL